MLGVELPPRGQPRRVGQRESAVVRPPAHERAEERASALGADHRPCVLDRGLAQRRGHDVVQRAEEEDRVERPALVGELGDGRERGGVPLEDACGARGRGKGGGPGPREVQETF